MNNQTELEEINRKIVRMKKIALELNLNEPSYPFLKHNTERILASIKMLELNVSDIAESY